MGREHNVDVKYLDARKPISSLGMNEVDRSRANGGLRVGRRYGMTVISDDKRETGH